ncbi:MAG: ACP S-malonyltransferase [Oscillospiraceae bacterium]
MAKIAALFSGQGSQYPGMGRELRETSAAAREVYACGGEILGMDIAKISAEGTEEELAATSVSQPAIFALSVASFRAAMEEMEASAAVAGHSLGEFAALCCAGAYSLEDGFRIIAARAAAMDRAAKTAKGAMFAIVGSDEETVQAACGEAGGFVQPVNFNLKNQTVISGEEEAAIRAAALLEGKGARVIRLSVASAFHTSMMETAALELARSLSSIAFHPVKMDFYSNLTGDRLVIEDYPAYFAKHMVSPVRFVEESAAMARDGITAAVEFGPKKTVATFLKKNQRGITVHNVEDAETLAKLPGFLAKLD